MKNRYSVPLLAEIVLQMLCLVGMVVGIVTGYYLKDIALLCVNIAVTVLLSFIIGIHLHLHYQESILLQAKAFVKEKCAKIDNLVEQANNSPFRELTTDDELIDSVLTEFLSEDMDDEK